jgi:hypothetical protein
VPEPCVGADETGAVQYPPRRGRRHRLHFSLALRGLATVQVLAGNLSEERLTGQTRLQRNGPSMPGTEGRDALDVAGCPHAPTGGGLVFEVAVEESDRLALHHPELGLLVCVRPEVRRSEQ